MTKDLTEIHNLLKSIKSFDVDDTIELLEGVMKQKEQRQVKIIIKLPIELYDKLFADSADSNVSINELIVDSLSHMVYALRGDLRKAL